MSHDIQTPEPDMSSSGSKEAPPAPGRRRSEGGAPPRGPDTGSPAQAEKLRVTSGLRRTELKFKGSVKADRYVESRILAPLELHALRQLGLPYAQILPPHQALRALAVISHAARLGGTQEELRSLLTSSGLARLGSLVRNILPQRAKARGSEAAPEEPDDADFEYGIVGYGDINETSNGSADEGLRAAVSALTANPMDKAAIALKQILASDVGVLFLDRTRIRPKGFVPGEHLTTLGLAPGEEVAVEQRSFSKREITYEEVNEVDEQFDIELASTLSTSVEEGLSRAETHNASSGWNIGGSLGVDVKAFKIGVDGGFSSSVSDADQKTRTRSRTDSWTASRKVASKYRTQHKTTFRIVTEQRFEVTSRRVLRNPNRYTPIDIHYFKVLQRLRMKHERYGVRLCWAPFVPDPAFDVLDRIQRQRTMIEAGNAPTLPPRPPEPAAPAARPPQVIQSAPVSVGDAAFGISVERTVSVDVPPDYVWDGDAEFVKASLVANFIRSSGWVAVWGTPTLIEGKPTATVHVGTDGSLNGRVVLNISARFVPLPTQADQDYATRYNEWRLAVQKWESDSAKLKADAAAKSQAEAEAYARSVWDNLDPVSELLHRIVSSLWPLSLRDEGSEVDRWRQLFEWEVAQYELYPGWWLDRPLREPSLAPTDFRNASWARVFLSIRPGREAEALRFIYTGGDESKLDAAVDHAITDAIDELSRFRLEYFGSAVGGPVVDPDDGCPELGEKVICLGKWTELLPTDGTHVEVTVSPTNAADALTIDELSVARASQLAMVQQTTMVSDLLDDVDDVSVGVRISIPGRPQGPGNMS